MTQLRELIKLAFRNIARNRRRSGITGVMVALGVIAIVFSRAYIDGLQSLILEFVVYAHHGAVQVERKGYADAQEIAPLDLDLADAPEVTAPLSRAAGDGGVARRIQYVGFISNGETSAPFFGLGIDPEADRKVCPHGPAQDRPVANMGAGIAEGRALRSIDGDEVVLTTGLAKMLGAKIGSTVTLLVRTRSGSMDAVDLTVVGLFQLPDPGDNKRTLMTPLTVTQRVLHMPGRVSAFIVGAPTAADISPTIARVTAAMAAVPDVEVRSWEELAPYYRDVMTLQNNVLGLVILVIFVLVVSGIVNTMLMSVFERTREVGTLMAMGFVRRRIMGLFLLEAAILGILASIVGALIGVGLIAWAHRHGIAFYVPAVGDVLNRPVLRPDYVLIACAGATLAGLVGGLYPAYRASRLRPIEALRVI